MQVAQSTFLQLIEVLLSMGPCLGARTGSYMLVNFVPGLPIHLKGFQKFIVFFVSPAACSDHSSTAFIIYIF
jgi:hypothetical protein